MFSNNKKHYHFMGIGGIGMSGLAALMHAYGHTVSGCDAHINQKSIKKLRNYPISIHPQETCSCELLPTRPTTFVYSSAIRTETHDTRYAHAHNIPLIHRSDLLASLFNTKKGIAISGAYGKTTTTALIAHCLLTAHIDISALVGGDVVSLNNSNWRYGASDTMVIEADESDRSFEKYHPYYTVITNIEREHVDVYDSDDIMFNAYTIFATNTDSSGFVILNRDNNNSHVLSKSIYFQKIIWFSGNNNNNADITISDPIWEKDHWTFTVREPKNNIYIPGWTSSLVGAHMLENIAATIAACRMHHIDYATIQKGIASCVTVDKRFSERGYTKNKTLIIDDYAHHPHEIKTLIDALYLKYPQHKKILIIEPHRYTRTHYFWHDYISVLTHAYRLDPTITQTIITDIFAASEEPIPNITSSELVTQIQQKTIHNCVYTPYKKLHEQLAHLTEKTDTNTVIVCISAGTLYADIHDVLENT